MKVLVWPQLSMRSYSTGKWHLEMDPNLRKNRAWVEAVPDWRWEWLLPHPQQWSPESHLGIPHGIGFGTMSYGLNVQANRYNFPYESVSSHIARVRPDAMILEIPEHAPAVRDVQRSLGLEFPIFSYVNYAPVLKYTRGDTMGRQVEGARASDFIVFNTPGLMDMWQGIARRDHWPGASNVRLWRGVYSSTEIEALSSGEVRVPPVYPSVFFTSRLSDPHKNRHPEFFRALDTLRDRFQFETWIGDPNRVHSPEELRTLAPNVTRTHCGSREEYIDWLLTSSIIPCLWEQDMIYSIGVCDAIAARAIVICSGSGQDKVPGIAVGPEPDADDLEEALEEAFVTLEDPRKYTDLVKSQVAWLEKFRGMEMNASRMVQDVENAVSG